MRKRILAMCLVISMLMAMLCGCGKTETTAYSGKTDTKADKGMAVMGEYPQLRFSSSYRYGKITYGHI